MPSGSHGGSHGGSHSSGGSHFGGSSSSIPPRPMRYYSHGHYYFIPMGPATKIRTKLSILFFMLIFMLFTVLPIVFSVVEINQIKADRERYIQMIGYSYEHPEYQVVGKVTGVDRLEDYTKYYFTYEIDIPGTSIKLKGYSYSLYTADEVSEIARQETLIFAVDKIPIDLNTDSIDLGYINKSLEDDYEYTNDKQAILICSIITGIFVVVVIVLAISSVKSLKVAKQEISKEKYNSQEMINSTRKNSNFNDNSYYSDYGFMQNNNNQNIYTEQSPTTCKYCGSHVEEKDVFCRSCGSKIER